ncbi:MAG TPA: DUF167 domain-containing protein [Gemmatimonadaceae bacterium]|nr:DUF167 domain-containing protein [Gemmatimonadaceae bacterium]
MSLVTVDVRGSAVRFRVRLQPRASRDEIVGVLGGALRIRLHAPPVDGAANDALVLFLAGRLSVPRRDVRIVTGTTSRTKMVEVDGVTSADVARLVVPSMEKQA